MSKRSLGLVVLLSMLMVLVFAGSVMAAQKQLGPAGSDAVGSYAPTAKVFNPDDNSLYPEEIYLPNEQNPSAYRIHSNYAKNTDACASCHATHTAVGASLLQWGTVYDTCIACHDGTISTTYNVKDGKIGATGKATFGGMFGTGAEGSYSSHNVREAVSIFAAPGGTNGSSNKNAVTGATASWDVEFGCESCHSPHGQGANARILSADPNGVAWEKYNKGLSKAQPLVDNGDGTYSVKVSGETANAFMIKGYPYSKVTKIYENGTALSGSQYTLDNKNGSYTVIKFDKGYTPTGTLTADFVPALKVKMTVSGYLSASEDVQHVSGLNGFCGACHADYDTEKVVGSGHTLSGKYTEAYRHKVGFNYSYGASKLAANNMKLESGNVTCETCHVAHGASETYWTNTVGTTWGTEQAGSSALKRLPNMGTCETCHQKGDGNEGYDPVVVGDAKTKATQVGAQYVGSTQCQSCHGKQFTGWQGTLHSKMIGGNAQILPAALDGNGGWKGGATLTDNQTGAPVTPADVVKIIGTKWKQRYLVGNAATGYHLASKQFNVVTGLFENYGSKFDWDKGCITCHSTGYRVNSYTEDAVTNTAAYDHSWTEENIGCEACHGPASNHVKSPNNANIWNPSVKPFYEQTKACGYCHIRGESNQFKSIYGTSLKLREDFPAPVGQIYKPGDDYSTWGLIPGMNDDLSKYTDPTSTLVPADLAGMMYPANGSGLFDSKKHHQQYQDFLQSKHYTNNSMGCSTCHTSHSRNSAKEQLKASSAQTCASCHGTTMNLTTYMPMTGKTVTNVYVRTHTFSKYATAQPAGALEPKNP